jgi:hypothetical protein
VAGSDARRRDDRLDVDETLEVGGDLPLRIGIDRLDGGDRPTTHELRAARLDTQRDRLLAARPDLGAGLFHPTEHIVGLEEAGTVLLDPPAPDVLIRPHLQRRRPRRHRRLPVAASTLP